VEGDQRAIVGHRVAHGDAHLGHLLGALRSHVDIELVAGQYALAFAGPLQVARFHPDHPQVPTDAHAAPHQHGGQHAAEGVKAQKALRVDAFDDAADLVGMGRDHQPRALGGSSAYGIEVAHGVHFHLVGELGKGLLQVAHHFLFKTRDAVEGGQLLQGAAQKGLDLHLALLSAKRRGVEVLFHTPPCLFYRLGAMRILQDSVASWASSRPFSSSSSGRMCVTGVRRSSRPVAARAMARKKSLSR